ncbi:phosphoribosylaminoimidazolesuccinocarboxamide synthase [Streptomyces sp. TRM66268-LWL]|uniref:phosphoribosylaminoimidazolesuccinocarboxamide synthase n=1 Tax=Streptomyces polyasparticus TaxID=2767826 RepID=A0ABR7SSQ5_9ACTN|nr:phosphoribosylaminoimidazolesuccinocarboxamide synthase [Streptomyces polyasparticus]MBC9718428.1 phosphoribosylaminoimidazolesuccinocarboxamide synthase [Streptomyces polyasparticus]
MPVLHSTKNLEVVVPPTATTEGVGIFEYTDTYSVFRFGPMPDTIPGKGEAVCRMAAFTFAMLEAAGVRTHFRRYIAPNRIEFSLARVPDPADPPPAGAESYLVPVQVLFRNEVPQGSSVHRRLADGTMVPADVGLRHIPAVGEILPRPILEYATMLGDTNEIIGVDEAQRLSGLTNHLFREMRDTAITVNKLLTAHANERGLRHCDGKAEFVVSRGKLMVADSPGTPDESRLLFDGVHCGKQVLRNWYVNNGLEVPVTRWIAAGVPRHHWPEPARLPPHFVPVMSDLYRSLSETWTGERRWNVPDLRSATRAVAELIDQ